MEQQAIESVTLGGSVAPYDLSVWGLFLQADLIVKIVMVLLFATSVWCWAIIIDKVLRLRRLRARARQFEEAFWSGGSLEDLYDRMGDRPADPMSAIFASAMREWRRSVGRALDSESARASLRQRLDRIMDISLGREMERLERHMIFLASTGSAAPFVGLFGTVWGIMNAFTSIAASKNTSLAVVAPGIAEALFATALGLVAAIPAVIAYNKLSTDMGRYAQRLENFAGEFGSILSRQLDDEA
jgi:biopolymer transport protein TolQ